LRINKINDKVYRGVVRVTLQGEAVRRIQSFWLVSFSAVQVDDRFSV